MFKVTITETTTLIELPNNGYTEKFNNGYDYKREYKTIEVFGDVYAILSSRYNENFDSHAITKNIIKYYTAQKREEWKNFLFSEPDFGETFYILKNYVNGRTAFSPTLQDFNRLRAKCGMNILPHYEEDKTVFENVANASGVILAILFYYAENGYKLTQCRHCEKWFATKNLKKQYCDRISPCNGMVIDGKQILNSKNNNCEQAVRTILQKFKDRHRVLYHRYSSNTANKENIKLLDELGNAYTGYSARMQELGNAPTKANIEKMQNFLYGNFKKKGGKL